MPAMNTHPGQLALDQALRRVEEHAPAEWRFAAERVVRSLAAAGQPFTTDQVWARVGAPPEPRALGAVIRSVARSGAIVPTGAYKPSERPECHRRDVKVWVGTSSARAAA